MVLVIHVRRSPIYTKQEVFLFDSYPAVPIEHALQPLRPMDVLPELYNSTGG
jgi:hypothetical protein